MVVGEGPIRVHRVIARLNVGGPAMHVVNLARGMGDGFRTRLLAGPVGAEEGDMGYYAQERGVVVTPVPSLRREVSPAKDAEALWTLVRWFRRERPHVVHTHTAKAGALGRLAAILAGVPVVVHTYHGHVLGGGYFSPGVTRAYRTVEQALGRHTTRLITLTQGLAEELAGVHRVAPRSRFAVVPLGLELDRFARVDRGELGPEVRAAVGTPGHVPVVGVVGRLVPIKNHELLLRALRRVLPAVPELELWVVGAGEREGELRALAEEVGVGDSVRWLGWRSDLDRLYAAMDVVALCSKDEGTPVALLEAAAAGVGIVSTRVGGISEMFAGLETPLRLVKPGDESGFAEALVQALRERRAADGALRAEVVKRYSVERLSRDMGELYRRLLRRGASGMPGAVGSSGP